MANWYDRHFKSEYDQDKKALKDGKAFAASWQPVVADLFQLMSDTGLDAGREVALARLRRKVNEGDVLTVGTKAVQAVTEEPACWLPSVPTAAPPRSAPCPRRAPRR